MIILRTYKFCKELFKIFVKEDGLRTASALTFTTLLAIVPFLTISVTIFATFPAFDVLRDDAQSMLTQIAVPEASKVIIEYVATFMSKAGQMTIFGIVGLLISSILLLANIEDAFNKIWHVRSQRGFVTRFLAFWAVITMAPLFMGLSIALSQLTLNYLTDLNYIKETTFVSWLRIILITVIQGLGLSLLYIFVPNKKVYFWHALCGGLFAAILLYFSKYLFAYYLSVFPAYQTIYGAVSSVPIFLIWLYIIWSFIIMGAILAAHIQNFYYFSEENFNADNYKTELLGVMILILKFIYADWLKHKTTNEESIRKAISASSLVVDEALDTLQSSKIIDQTYTYEWTIAQDPHKVTVMDICILSGYNFEIVSDFFAKQPNQDYKHLAELFKSTERTLKKNLSKPLTEIL